MTDNENGSQGAVQARAEVVVQCTSSGEAQVLWDSLSADDPGSVEGLVEGDRLRLRVGPAAMASLRTTLDDLLACAQAASGAAAAQGPSGVRDVDVAEDGDEDEDEDEDEVEDGDGGVA